MTPFHRGAIDLDAAVEAYAKGYPVVVFAAGDALVHGKQTLEAIAQLGFGLNTIVIRQPFTVQEFEATDWPEVLEAARHTFMEQGGFEIKLK